MTLPAFSEGQQRLLYNLTYYRSNYFVVFLGLTAYMLYAQVPRMDVLVAASADGGAVLSQLLVAPAQHH